MKPRSILAIPVVLCASALQATEPDKPITDREPDAADVAATPITDLNLRKDEIPEVLLRARDRPYDSTGLNRCAQIAAAVGELESVLGEDIDIPAGSGKPVKPGKVAQWVVGSFIPFRGLIRELSGANEQERRVQLAIQAGFARRAYLKGLGQARNCRYPARPATAAVIAQYKAESARPAPAVEADAVVSTDPRRTLNSGQNSTQSQR